jgi:hypothetical protein
VHGVVRTNQAASGQWPLSAARGTAAQNYSEAVDIKVLERHYDRLSRLSCRPSRASFFAGPDSAFYECLAKVSTVLCW